MTQHAKALTIDRAIPAAEAAPGLSPDHLADGRPIDLPPPDTARREAPVSPAPKAVAEAPTPPASGRRPLRRLLLAGAGLAVLAGAGYFGWQYWTVGRFQVSTDDAYVQADNTTIAPKISGYIMAVPVADNQPVKAGQVLARIDDRDFRVALDQAKADVAAARASLASQQASLDAQQSVIDNARAAIDVDRANQTFAEQDDKRYTALAHTGFGSVQNAEQATARIAAARASVERDTATLATAVKQVDILKAQVQQAQAGLAHDEAAERQAELNLSYTTITAPVDGVVGNRTLRVGQYVQAGTQLMAVVPAGGTYVVANYKETQLTDVRPGQAVELEVDMFPGVTVHGHVDSIAPASGQEFALLPPDNATGNFTKIVQRIPVKIVLDPHEPLADGLRPGMSVYPTIETRAARQG
ncbi:HlyD family secretion protein [Labrys wisconsinensis]|uniref:Membrane fusion protein (Multidrug efflux system) n=1 Tax=Labrys wisconsinensis TaxID=425677 RepID=A0ABU0J9P3_9HYPH|nr:HlyD family secretion protein [Labrys wisconsinensis]MDQ0470995.1 membrane fusion protein (multidrug efflux system) [Labrys wisconsinensis]